MTKCIQTDKDRGLSLRLPLARRLLLGWMVGWIGNLALLKIGLDWLGRDSKTLPSLAPLWLLALGLGLLWGLALTEPLGRALGALVQGARRLSQGRYSTHIALKGQDELFQLAQHFNSLAAGLVRQEEARKHWVADFSHELRTPLAVLRAEIEAWQDGIRQPDTAGLERVHAQVMALCGLTDDLFQLARADVGQLNYRMQAFDMLELLRECAQGFEARLGSAGLELQLRLPPQAWIRGDRDRLRQLFNNLLENSLRYTHSPGLVRLSCVSQSSPDKPRWLLAVEDSPPGVAQELLQRLGERFFRVEKSRSKQLGGSGLGLAIAQSIAEAHQGRLEAAASDLGGLRMELSLPQISPPGGARGG